MSGVSESSISIVSSVRAGTVISLASKMFESAIMYTKELGQYEVLENEQFREVEAMYDAHAISVIILCTSALEAKINQFYEFSCGQQGEAKFYLDTLRNQKYLVTAKYGITEKYNSILELLNKKPFRKPNEADYNGDNARYAVVLQKYELFRSLIDLVTLRNAIVHYNPEIHYETHEPISMKMYNLFNIRFSAKRSMTNSDTPYFPSQCLGFGSAKWAVTTTFLFWEEYFKRTEVEREIQHYSLVKPKVDMWL